MSTTVKIDGKEFSLNPVDPDAPNWKVTLNGEDITPDVETLTVINESMGMGALYGINPGAPSKDPTDPINAKRRFGQVQFVNRGGAVIVPSVQLGNELYFLVLDRTRLLAGPDSILEFPRGQANQGEKSIDTARRELLEETGLGLSEESLIYLGHGNPDTALVHGANVHAWWLKLPMALITIEDGKPVLDPGFEADSESRLLEDIKKAEFISEHDLFSECMMSMWAKGLVLQRIRSMERSIFLSTSEAILPYSSSSR